jgi:hypothetical protein
VTAARSVLAIFSAASIAFAMPSVVPDPTSASAPDVRRISTRKRAGAVMAVVADPSGALAVRRTTKLKRAVSATNLPPASSRHCGVVIDASPKIRTQAIFRAIRY